ncbi:MAG: hypothetical protein VBE63_20230 [Lamprobacter sp.]|uniref:hypothetical protein n=1 Tax=Lamprobacter sp. TaxID=3100796 RepID=UPI002B26257A|nr:hypothetical protein [Lamprobacter sp.]MEA3642246.1 hypothetical protein [Lamprobacter sp.]
MKLATILVKTVMAVRAGDAHSVSCAKYQPPWPVKSPFKPISFLQATELQAWLNEFPDHAMSGSGLGDLSIIHDWQRLCAQNRGRRVYIWSLDDHLRAYDRAAEV